MPASTVIFEAVATVIDASGIQERAPHTDEEWQNVLNNAVAMNNYIGVVTNPYYAVSGGDGTFKITGVPAGKRTVQIWHERCGPLMQPADVPAGGTATVDFTDTGAEKPAAAAGLRVREITIPTATF